MAYSLYAMKLPGPEDKLPLEQTQALWQETVEQQIFVLCKTRMAGNLQIKNRISLKIMLLNIHLLRNKHIRTKPTFLTSCYL